MNKKELTEAIKIIYDALNEGKDSAKEIEDLKDELGKRDFLLKLMIRVFSPIVKSTQFSFGLDITPFEMVRYMRDVIDHNVVTNNQSVIDDKFIDEMIQLMQQKNY